MINNPPPPPGPQLDHSPAARRRDRIRIATASGTGLSAVLCGVLLQGQQALQTDTARLADQIGVLQSTIERVQSAREADQRQDHVAHQGIDAKLSDYDQRTKVVTLTLEALARNDNELGLRVNHLERQIGTHPYQSGKATGAPK